MKLGSIDFGALGRVSPALLLAWPCVAMAQGTQTARQMPDQFEPAAKPAREGPAVSLQFNYSADLNADLSGGAQRGAAYLGKAAVIADADLDRLIGLPDATAHARLIDIHGTGLSGSRVDNLAAVSGMEAEPAIRLNQAWIELGIGRGARLRVGKFAALDFMASSTAAFFVNSTFGWPASFASDLPQGGPSWPIAAPGAMISLPVTPKWSLTAAIFAGTPAGRDDGDPQRIDDHGLGAFRLAGKLLVIAEAARRLGEAATIKVGGWVHFAQFALVDPDAKKTSVSPNWAGYVLADWRVLGNEGDARQLTLFARASVSPADRNPVGVYVDLGAELTAPFVGRPKDAVGLAYAMTRLSPRLFAPGGARAEHVVELSYSAAVTSSVTLQPNLQLIVNPIDPSTFTGAKATALVAGMRFNAQF